MLAFAIQPLHVKLFLDFVTLRFGGFAILIALGFMIKQKAKLDHRYKSLANQITCTFFHKQKACDQYRNGFLYIRIEQNSGEKIDGI